MYSSFVFDLLTGSNFLFNYRIANLYFIFIVVLNWQIGAFAKEVSLMPVVFVLGVTAIKDLFEDRRRRASDKRINNSTCRVYNGWVKDQTDLTHNNFSFCYFCVIFVCMIFHLKMTYKIKCLQSKTNAKITENWWCYINVMSLFDNLWFLSMSPRNILHRINAQNS